MSDALQLTRWLVNWPQTSGLGPADFTSAPFRRLASALAELERDGPSVGSGDLAGLIRTVLMHEAARDGAQYFVVPDGSPFPSLTEWTSFGVLVVGRDGNHLRVAANPWRPDWLELDGPSSVDERAYNPRDLRAPADIPVDPCLQNLVGDGFVSYRSPGQAMAVRSVFLADAGSTLLINLPTGQGKSLAFQGFARWSDKRGGLTILVVPTTALAKDHERRFHDNGWTSVPLAFHSGLPEREKSDLKKRIREGVQPVVISSPEALLGSLRRLLVERAKAGAVAQFVVDEAHMLQQWGVEFRPSYQFVPAFRDLLVESSPEGTAPKTLLLSATVTDAALSTLQSLFGSVEQVSAVHLRPEPEFWVKRAGSKHEKGRLIEEAVRLLPRPFILYTSTRADAREFFGLVRGQGITRVRRVVGGTPLESILSDWQMRNVDIVVATSAFGLGVDNNEVRAVLHACVPETVDRFYQEVGRSGRDGRGAIALSIHTDCDWDTARTLSSTRVITPELGWTRWSHMWTHRVSAGRRRYLVDLSLAHP